MFKFSKNTTAMTTIKSTKIFLAQIVLTTIFVAPSFSLLAAEKYSNIGRAATSSEIKAWDIDVRPDFKGLPKGSGTVAQGEQLFEAKCASCHGIFGESNEVFTPLVGGTTKEDIKNGKTHSLFTGSVPQRTTFMKVATISTIFDYIQRAMPWTEPKSLKANDVYAILAYLLNTAEIIPADFVLNEQTIREVQKLMPNRNGMTTKHAMWPGKGMGNEKPDTQNTACMKNCKPKVEQVSQLPDYAWNAHGNLSDQSRDIGDVRYKATDPSAPKKANSRPLPHPIFKIAQANGCMACHGIGNKIVGPGYKDIAKKYQGQEVSNKILAKIKAGGSGVWGDVPMPAQAHIKEEDLKKLITWILEGAPTEQ